MRRRLVSGQILTSDGISPGTLRGLYQTNYEERLRTGRFPVTIMPSRTVTGARHVGDEIELECLAAGGEETHRTAYVIVATGRRLPRADRYQIHSASRTLTGLVHAE